MPSPLSTLSNRVRWLIAIRALVLCSIVLPYYLLSWASVEAAPEVQAAAMRFLVQAGSVQLALSLVLLWLLAERPMIHLHLQFAGDVILVTALLYRLGSGGNTLLVLYLVVIIVAAVLVGRTAALTVAAGAFAAWALPLLSVALEWTLLARLFGRLLGDLGELMPSNLPLEYHLLLNLAGFAGVAVLTSQLAARAERTESELRQQARSIVFLRALHHDVIQSITSGLVTADARGRLLSHNAAAEEILGRPLERLMPLAELELVDGEHLHRFLDGTADDGVSRRAETILERADGTQQVIGYSLSHLRREDDEGEGVILVFQDLTEHRRMEEQLRIRDRMAAVGEMAAGLAHEVGNPLASITGSVQMLAEDAEVEGDARQLLDIILRESRRLDRTVKGFLAFAKPRPRRTQRFDVAALVMGDVKLLRHSEEVTPAHRVETYLEPPSAWIVGDPDQIGQVFWNLARNAVRAMPEGGRLRIVGGFTDDGERYRLSFEDAGRGMSEEERANVFHPFKSFFDGGMGIGMAIVYRIVEEHGGRIQVESEPGKGTRITVELPAAGLPSDAPASAKERRE